MSAPPVVHAGTNGHAAQSAPVVIKPLPAELAVGSVSAAGLEMVETRAGVAMPTSAGDAAPVARAPRTIVHEAMPSVDDLIQVETHPTKRVTTDPFGEAAAVPHAPRQQVQAPLPLQSEPLSQVETRK